MAGTQKKRLFTAEIKMMQEKGQKIPQHGFDQADVPADAPEKSNGTKS
tara:strand:- start:117 stop:260 length:144 start_codon:yes stop_codon:yes gene_type:complete